MHFSFDLQRRRLIMATGASLLPTALYACRNAVAATATDGYRTVKDMHGRTVKVPRSVTRLVCTGSGALLLIWGLWIYSSASNRLIFGTRMIPSETMPSPTTIASSLCL